MEKFEIAILVDNQPGVLTRISSMFTRRGFNINSLSVGTTEDPRYSRMTISVFGDEEVKKQILKQCSKLYNVEEVKFMEPGKRVNRELALIKLRNKPSTRREILDAVDIFRSRIIDYSPNTLCVEITGESSKINAFIKAVEPLGILEMCRTGVVSLDRGCTYLKKDIQTIIDNE